LQVQAKSFARQAMKLNGQSSDDSYIHEYKHINQPVLYDYVFIQLSHDTFYRDYAEK